MIVVFHLVWPKASYIVLGSETLERLEVKAL